MSQITKIAQIAAFAALAALAVVPAANARDKMDPLPGTYNGLAKTPPMGWNSWNKFACHVNEKLIKQAADAMVSSGMKDAGYTYIVIDDCWQGKRDKQGFIHPDAKKFPSGIKALADYVHMKGLKFGIYSDAGSKTCGGFPGSRGHEYQDAATYAKWGVDYLKYDWCHTGTQNAEASYLTMSNALQATGRKIVFSMCEWGNSKPWLWAKKVGNLWRTTGDIWDHWQGKKDDGYSIGMLDIVDMMAPITHYAGPGHWNDPDMLEVGNGGMTDNEYRAHFSLWAMFAAPLIAGNDLATMRDATKKILMNKDVIAVDQDVLGVAAERVWKQGDLEIWSRPLKNGARAVVLLNRGTRAQKIKVNWEQLHYPAALRVWVRDLWRHHNAGMRRGAYSAKVAGHSVVMVRLTPQL